MAEEDSGQDRREAATPRRVQRAREEGQVPRSRELDTSAILLAGSAALLLFGGALVERMLALGREAFRIGRAEVFDPQIMVGRLGAAGEAALAMLAPVFILLLVAALLAPAALGGWVFSARVLAPRLERLDPVRGLQRMFSLRALVELLKAVAKVLVVGGVALLLLWGLRHELLALAGQPPGPALRHAGSVLGWSALALSASTLLIAAVDMPFQLFEHARRLRMTTQQLRDELKETEGQPEPRSRIRRLQRGFARSRMMAAVPRADVVITDHAHFAVALRYEDAGAAAPVLLARGADRVALKIREVAEANGVAVVNAPRLARAICFSTGIEAEIPAQLYPPVAQVLAYVFHLRNYRRAGGSAPVPPPDLPVPEGMDRAPGRNAR